MVENTGLATNSAEIFDVERFLTPYTGFFLSVKFATSLLALLAGR